MYKPSKYRAKKTEYNGIMYDSKREAKRAKELDFMQSNGIIKGLQRQVKFNWIETHQIGVNFEEKTISFKRSYIADFVYFDIDKKCDIVEDVKGFKTPEYKKKKKIVEKIFSIKIVEI
jgi:hypothetical protein